MKRLFCISLLMSSLHLCSTPLIAQTGLVHDPLQTSISSVDASSSLTELINILEQLFENTEILEDLRAFQKRNFGEGSWGEKARERLQQLGYLEDMVRSFNATTKVATEYMKMLKSSDIDPDLIVETSNQILRMVLQSKQLVEYCKTIFAADDKTISEKENASRIIRDSLLQVQMAVYDHTIQRLQIAQATSQLVAFDDFMNEALSSESYVNARKSYGSLNSNKTSIFELIYLLIGLLGILSLIWAWISMVRGGASGDETSKMGFIRIGIAMMVASLVLSAIDLIFSSTL